MLFIDHDQAQVAHRREYPRPRPDHNAGRARPDPAPLVGAFGVAERAMQNSYAVAESRKELAGHGRRQRDLGHQQQRAAFGRQRGLDRVQIYLRLTGPSHAMQEKRPELPFDNRIVDLYEGFLLAAVERGPLPGCIKAADGHRLAGKIEHLLFGKGAGGGARVAD